MNTQVYQSPSESSQRINKNKFVNIASNCSVMGLLLLNAASNVIYSQVFNVSGTISTDTTPVRYASVTFTDKNDVSKKYSTITDGSGNYQLSVITEVSNQTTLALLSIELEQNYPNPFNSETTIELQIKDQGLVVLKIYDILGREITTLINENKFPGSYTMRWNATGMPSGVYSYRLITKKGAVQKKMIIIR